MSIVGARIELRGKFAAMYAPGHLFHDEVREAERQAFQAALVHWHAKMLPNHFKPNAKQVYRYEMRTRRYQERKQRVMGHNRYLVWTGESQRQAERKIVVRSTKKETTGRISVAKAFNFSGRAGMPDMKGEVKKILKREKKVLFRLIHDEVVRRLNPEGDRRLRVAVIPI